MSYFEEQLLWAWVILVTLIYPLFIFRGQARLRDQLERLQRKVIGLKYERSGSGQPAQPAAVPPPAPLPPVPVETTPEIRVEPAAVLQTPPPLPPKPSEPSADRFPEAQGAAAFELPPREAGAFELAAKGLLSRIWNWILVGEEYRKPGVSVEFALATNWLVRIGVLTVVVGVGFFLDYSASMGWLNNAGKVLLASTVGGALVGWGMLNMNRRYHLLGQGLIGAGLAILYTSMFAAYQHYDLINAVTAFAAMFFVTLAAAWISVSYRSLLVAVLGIIGGYLTPFLLPESGALLSLLVYLAILGLGVLLISIRRQWFLLNLLAFFFNSLHVLAILVWWHATPPFRTLMPFLLVYFLLFSTSAFLFQVRQKIKATWLDLAFMLMNAGVFFGSAGFLILEEYAWEWVAALSLFLALFYACHLFVLVKRRNEDKGLVLCFLSLMSFFLLLTVPLYFSAAWWSLSWSLLALVLLAGSQKTNSRFLEQIALGIFVLSLYRFLQRDLAMTYGPPLPPNMPMSAYFSALLERLMQLGVPLASLAAALRLQTHPLKVWEEFTLGEANDSAQLFPPDCSRWLFRGALLSAGFLALHLEMVYSFGTLFAPAVPPLLTLVWIAAAWVLLHWTRRHTQIAALQFLLFSAAVAVLCKWLFWDLQTWGHVLPRGLFAPYSFLDAGMRLVDFLIRFAFLFYGFCALKTLDPLQRLRIFFGYAALGTLWFYSTLEINSLLAAFVPGLRSGGLSVYWGLFALMLVSGGLVKRHRPLRLLGLGLFSWVALKVFFHDLASLDPIYKIVAFILLGVVILGGAYVYMRFQDRFSLDLKENLQTGLQ